MGALFGKEKKPSNKTGKRLEFVRERDWNHRASKSQIQGQKLPVIPSYCSSKQFNQRSFSKRQDPTGLYLFLYTAAAIVKNGKL